MRVKVAWNPKSSNLREILGSLNLDRGTKSYRSASSKTKTSSSFTLTMPLPLPSRNSSTRPGVPITISAPVEINRCISSVVEDCVEDTRSSGGGYSGGGVSSAIASSTPGDDCRDGGAGCEDKNKENTECIWLASSLRAVEVRQDIAVIVRTDGPRRTYYQRPNLVLL